MSRAMRIRGRGLLGALAASATLMFVATAPAAAAPAWSLTSTSDTLADPDGQSSVVTTTQGSASPAVNEVQELSISASDGQFRISYGGETTSDLDHDAPAAQVQTALEGLGGIDVGDVSVTGGPSFLGAAPYIITFGGALAAQDVEEFGVENGSDPLHGIFTFYIDAINVGDSNTAGVYTVTASLPPGMTAISGSGFTCAGAGTQTMTCTRSNVLTPRAARLLTIVVGVDPSAAGSQTAHFQISGGGAPTAVETLDQVTVSNDVPTFDVEAFDGNVDADATGTPETRAGARPYSASTVFDLARSSDPRFLVGALRPVESLRNVEVDLPPGFVGDPTGPTTCASADFASSPGTAGGSFCAPTSQVGTVALSFSGQGSTKNIFSSLPLYSLEPPPGVPARFGFKLLDSITVLDAEVRSESDYGLTVRTINAPQALPVIGTKLTFWGVPSDDSHTPERACLGERTPPDGGPTCSSGTPPEAFLRNPTSCTPVGTGLQTTLRADSWEDSGDFKSASFETHLPPGYPVPAEPSVFPAGYVGPTEWGLKQGPENCESVPFTPSFEGSPATGAKAGKPAGFAFDLSLPQNSDPAAISQSDLKQAVVTLPDGMVVNPSAADGLGACSLADAKLDSREPADCPDSSKIGTVEIDTPLLEDPLEGAAYLAKPFDNPFDSLLAIYLVAEDSGVVVKLPGELSADPDTGQLTATFDNQPQLPFSSLHLQFKGGTRAPLVMPDTCGTHEITSQFFPWARPGDPVSTTSSFEITEGPDGKPCSASLADRPFNPKLNSGVSNPIAGSYSPFVFQLTREDGDQEILSTTVNPPQGLTAKLAGIPYCSEADIAAHSCAEESRIGTQIAGAGAGSSPFYTTQNPGSVYLAGPYKGAPLSMVIHDPVVAGPLDLSDITVRAAIHVDPRTAELTVESDPIPQIVDGIPLRIRDLRIKMDRPDFTIAPTNCDPMEVNATVEGSHGATANLTNHFQVGDCGSLGFSPKLKLGFGKAKKNTKPNSHPPLNAKLRFNEGDANISRVEVVLPRGLLLDQDRIGRICSRDRYAAGTCPESSRVGYAKAITPLLDDPVEGPVYLKASDNLLPDLAADLDGQIDVDLFGRIDQKVNKKGVNQIRNTFDVVPDVPVSDFELTLDGGSDGLLVNSRNICRNKKSQRLSIDMAAHNEMTLSEKPLVGSACKQINKKKASKLKAKARKLLKKAKKTDSKRKAKKLRKQARKLKKQARKLGR